jgi:hypothetical protein
MYRLADGAMNSIIDCLSSIPQPILVRLFTSRETVGEFLSVLRTIGVRFWPEAEGAPQAAQIPLKNAGIGAVFRWAGRPVRGAGTAVRLNTDSASCVNGWFHEPPGESKIRRCRNHYLSQA